MSLKHVLMAAAAVSMTATPVLAAPAANPAAKLSVASQARAGSSTARDSEAAGGGALIAALIAAGVAAIVIIDAVQDDDDPDSP